MVTLKSKAAFLCVVLDFHTTHFLLRENLERSIKLGVKQHIKKKGRRKNEIKKCCGIVDRSYIYYRSGKDYKK